MDRLGDFTSRHPAARIPMACWVETVKTAHWTNFVELRQTYRSADYVGGYIVFNVGGNKFRIIAAVSYQLQRVLISKVMTHKDYDRWSP